MKEDNNTDTSDKQETQERQETQEARFETGYIDEVVLECDNLGDIEQLWVFPDEGTWRLEYIVLHHLNTNEMSQFNCDHLIGSDDHPAVIMRKNELNVFLTNIWCIIFVCKIDILICNPILVSLLFTFQESKYIQTEQV